MFTEVMLPCPVCSRPRDRVYARPTGLEGWPHVVVYRHVDGAECEDWRGAVAFGLQPREHRPAVET